MQGKMAEDRALVYLQQRGLVCVTRNYACRFGEIDLIMKEGDLLFFKKPELAQLQAQGVPSFGVTVGNRGSSVAVRVEKQLVPGHI